MRTNRALSALIPLVLATATLQAQTRLEIGKMWLFENPPLAYLEEEYGFKPTQEWLDALRLASLRFGDGCSASFVSPKGLIMTNHHCVRSYIAQVTPEDQDWVKNGFYATSLDDEVPIPGLTVQQLVSMTDVTDAVNDGVADGDDVATVREKQRKNQDELVAKAKQEHPDLQPQVVALHQGALYHLYLYRIYDDIRLVCSPHLQTSHFGGDPDNFTYPRYALDFSFCRAWKDGKPVDTSEHYFKWSKQGAQQGDLVFVTGNPGSTARLQTYAQLEYLRDANYPMVLDLIDSRLKIMGSFAERSPEMEKKLRTTILTYENGQKAYRGYYDALLDSELMTKKAANEAQILARVNTDPELRRRYASLWSDMAAVASLQTTLEAPRRFYLTGGSKHLARAVEMVRAYTDPEKHDDHLAHAVGMDTQMSDYDRAMFVDHLERAQRWLPKDDPYLRAVLGDRTPEQVADLLEHDSMVSQTEWVQPMLEGGVDKVLGSEDPALRIAVAIEPLMKAQEQAFEWLADREQALGQKIARAVFAVYGDRISPDATFTLRFSDGLVKGYPFNGTLAPWHTVFYGLYARNTVFGGEHPFDLPQAWLDRKDRIDMTRSVDFVSTNDIIGGNSGSPMVSKDLEVVGLVFDGNIQMLANRFLYSDEVARAVSVHVHGIEEALAKIYDATRLLGELKGSDPQ